MTQMKLKGMPVTRDSYNTLLKAHACSRDADGAVGLLRTMQRQGFDPNLNIFPSFFHSHMQVELMY
jgi:pentatricopeptide repeat protein